MASAGIGGPQHAAGELFKYLAGVDMMHVPYRGSTPAMTDLIGGQVQVMFDVTPTALPQVKAGQARARSGCRRRSALPALPDVPPIGDIVKGYEASAWIGIGAPKDTPAGDHRDRSTRRSTRRWSTTKIKQRLTDLGADAAAADDAGRVRQVHRRRRREMGEGDQGGGHEAGVT